MVSLTKNAPFLRKSTQFMQPKKPNLLRRLYDMYKRHLELVRVERKLMALDDRLLEDIGISRGDIHHIIRCKHRKNTPN